MEHLFLLNDRGIFAPMPQNLYRFAWLLVLMVFVTGLFFPYLQGSDATEYASIATQMFFRHDWVNIVNHHPQTGAVYDYLDKPHLLFWSALLGFKLFGVHEWSYRLISVLMTGAAFYAVFKTGLLLYNETVGKMAALFFATAQAIILANHDVKTDTLLTSFIALAVWQLVAFVQTNRWQNVVWAGAFLAGGVGTKGMIAVLVSGCVVFFYILGLKRWKMLYNPRWLLGVLSFFFFLSPILYCYYLQFDLHPEKFVNGGYNRSGIKFLLWSQSFERFAGDRNFVMYPEFSFFFHTFLWAFLPWSLLAYTGVFYRLKEGFQTGGTSFFTREQLSFTGVWAMFLLMSLSKFKLPHYINVLFPIFSVFTAGFLWQLYYMHKDRFLKRLTIMQWVVVAILLVLLIVLNVWSFPANPLLLCMATAGFAFVFYLALKPQGNVLFRSWYPSVIAALVVNVLLNTNFYPKNQQYQGGMMIGRQMLKDNIDWGKVYNYQKLTHWFDFYSQHWQPVIDDEGIRNIQSKGGGVLLYVNGYMKHHLDDVFASEIIYAAPDFEVAGLTGKFINPKTRKEVIDTAYLVRIR